LRARDVDGARLETLVTRARAQRRSIRASTWPVERVEALLARDVLELYLVKNRLRGRPDGKESVRRKKKSRQNIVRACETFQREFPDSQIGELKSEWVAQDYEIRTGCKPRTRYVDLRAVKMALNGGLDLLGAALYRVAFDNPNPGRVDKRPWTPDEYDRLLAAAHGTKTLPDGTRVPGVAGYRGQWRRGIPFLTETASRHGILPNVRWVPPWEEPSDGLPLAMCDRAWIEVTPDNIYFHRDGGMPYDSNKGRAGNVIPREFQPEVRRWFEFDMSIGKEFVFRRKNGMRYVGPHIGRWTFRRIVKDAGIPWKRVAHHFKDLSKEVAQAAGMGIETFGAHADTSTKTLEGTYGDPQTAALLQDASEQMSQVRWRERAAARQDIIDRFRQKGADAGRVRAGIEGVKAAIPAPGPAASMSSPAEPGRSKAAAR
jgi:hypothetical protein